MYVCLLCMNVCKFVIKLMLCSNKNEKNIGLK